MTRASDRPSSYARIAVKVHRRVALIRTEDGILSEELLAHKKLTHDIVGRLSDCVLLIRPGHANAVVQELQKLGHTPRVIESTSLSST